MLTRLGVALLFAVVMSLPKSADAAGTTNYTDQWWTASQSGWGASVLQQHLTLFIDLFVYGADGKAIWFTAAAVYSQSSPAGHIVFAGDLYQTNGPYFGGPFNPAAVGLRKVGTLTFDSDSVYSATLTYSVDGVSVSKAVTRQLWAYENLAGSYYGGLISNYTGCTNPSQNGRVEELGAFQIAHSSSNALSITFSSAVGGTCVFSAPYTQEGHMGLAQGNYSCSNGVSGVFTAFELEKNISGMTGRFFGSNQFCSFTGRLGGLLR